MYADQRLPESPSTNTTQDDANSHRMRFASVLECGVIDTCTNYVEHPQLVAQRICQYVDIVGRERVIAGTDCGFATFVGHAGRVDPEIAYRKLGALVEGAKLASAKLWH